MFLFDMNIKCLNKMEQNKLKHNIKMNKFFVLNV